MALSALHFSSEVDVQYSNIRLARKFSLLFSAMAKKGERTKNILPQLKERKCRAENVTN